MDQTLKEATVDISVIVPVYNVEKFIYRCLDSIYSQKFSGRFEVITVDDGSTDNSLFLLKKYKEKESCLKIIEHQINRKLSVARRTGINAATGDYIMHVDSDDWLLPGAFENLFSKCKETDADVIVFNHLKEDNNEKRTVPKQIIESSVVFDKKKVHSLFLGAVWNKIVKRRLITNLISGEVGINTTEDLLYATEILLKCQKVILVKEPYYVYFTNYYSLSLEIKPDQLLDRQIIVLRELKRIFNKYNADSDFILYILTYLEKDIFLAISQAAFLTIKGGQNFDLLNSLKSFSELSGKRIKVLSMSMSNKYYSLLPVLTKFGPKPVFGIIMRSLKKSILRNPEF